MGLSISVDTLSLVSMLLTYKDVSLLVLDLVCNQSFFPDLLEMCSMVLHLLHDLTVLGRLWG